MKVIITSIFVLLFIATLPAIIHAGSGIIKYQTVENHVTKWYDHDESVICYTYNDAELTWGDVRYVGGISCVKDN